ncbi:unnamed protein product, partial [Linum tenue]
DSSRPGKLIGSYGENPSLYQRGPSENRLFSQVIDKTFIRSAAANQSRTKSFIAPMDGFFLLSLLKVHQHHIRLGTSQLTRRRRRMRTAGKVSGLSPLGNGHRVIVLVSELLRLPWTQWLMMKELAL